MDEVRSIKVADETPERVAELFGVDPETAEFMIAIERGEIQGDAGNFPSSEPL
jgi:hypothetical protein